MKKSKYKLVVIFVIFIIIISYIFLNIGNPNFHMYGKKNKNYIHVDPINVDEQKIDIVYTWVGYDEKFQKEMNKYSGENKEIKLRFEDHNEIFYSVHSVMKNFPQYNNIYIVVKDGQIPPFTKKFMKDNKIKVVNHSSIIPKKYLPTFNSTTIELFLHKISGLNEYYIYFNDDNFLNTKVDNSFFINENGLPNVLAPGISVPQMMYRNTQNINGKYNFKGAYNFSSLIYFNIKLLSKLFGVGDFYLHGHLPNVCKKQFEYRIIQNLKKINYNGINVYENNCKSRFRENNNLALNSMLRYYYYLRDFKCHRKKTSIMTFYSSTFKLYSIIKLKLKYDFICVNDMYDEDVEKFQQMFQEKYVD